MSVLVHAAGPGDRKVARVPSIEQWNHLANRVAALEKAKDTPRLSPEASLHFGHAQPGSPFYFDRETLNPGSKLGGTCTPNPAPAAPKRDPYADVVRRLWRAKYSEIAKFWAKPPDDTVRHVPSKASEFSAGYGPPEVRVRWDLCSGDKTAFQVLRCTRWPGGGPRIDANKLKIAPKRYDKVQLLVFASGNLRIVKPGFNWSKREANDSLQDVWADENPLTGVAKWLRDHKVKELIIKRSIKTVPMQRLTDTLRGLVNEHAPVMTITSDPGELRMSRDEGALVRPGDMSIMMCQCGEGRFYLLQSGVVECKSCSASVAAWTPKDPKEIKT